MNESPGYGRKLSFKQRRDLMKINKTQDVADPQTKRTGAAPKPKANLSDARKNARSTGKEEQNQNLNA